MAYASKRRIVSAVFFELGKARTDQEPGVYQTRDQRPAFEAAGDAANLDQPEGEDVRQRLVPYQSVKSFLEELQENCLLLARHGETDWNARGLIQGQQDRPLSALGYRQRKVLFFRLRSVALTRIFTSGLERTIQTALPLNAELGLSQEVLPALNEARLGVFEGESKTEFADELSARLYAEFLADEVNVVLPGGGENLRQLDARIQDPLKVILESLHSGHVLVVAHRNVNKMLIKNLLRLSFEQAQLVEHKNHWLYLFAPRGRKIFLAKINDTTEPLVIRPGYEEVTVTPPAAVPSRVERGS